MAPEETVLSACSGQAIVPRWIAALRPKRISKLCCRRAAEERETAVKQALRQLLGDFLSAILFLVVYAVSGSLFAGGRHCCCRRAGATRPS